MTPSSADDHGRSRPEFTTTERWAATSELRHPSADAAHPRLKTEGAAKPPVVLVT